MSGYQRKSLQILGGGWNLLPPGDKVPRTDYLLAQNWRSDREGKLVSRYGYPRKFQFAGPAVAHSGAVFGGVEGAYYVGTNNASGPTPGALYYNLTTSIATGFDGLRIALVPMNGWMWVMNRANQGRHHNPEGWQTWNLTAPVSAPTTAAGSADPTGPNGTYQYYVSYESTDGTLESNAGPGSIALTVVNQDVNLTAVPVSGDARVGKRNIYASGGGLGQAYLVATIADNTTTTVTVTISDAAATNEGIVMPTTNDPPPAASGMVGAYFERLIAFSTAAHPSRLFWTDPNLPQYFPGSADPAVGNWVDVGEDGEAIVWCTIHTNVLVIYKERTIWRLIGDPDTGYLEKLHDGLGLVSQQGVIAAGPVDYFVGPNALYLNTLDRVQGEVGEAIRPLFNANVTNSGVLTTPGSILPGTQWLSSSLYCYAVALGYAMGKLYVSYAEQATPNPGRVLLVYHESTGRWFYHRDLLTSVGFQGFIWDGIQMVGLTGNGLNSATGYNIDDFRQFPTADFGGAAIETVYQSHFEDCGLPDIQKTWLEIGVDLELAGDTVSVEVAYDNNGTLTSLGNVTFTGRQTKSFVLGTDGVKAKNISVAIFSDSTLGITLHNVYLYYYEEARLGLSASSLPVDLGSPKVKQCKELQLDIDNPSGTVTAKVYTDLPANALAVRTTQTVSTGSGRALMKFPFSAIEGYLYRLALSASQPFRVYGARLLLRPVGTYIEAYEAAAGFVWDSQEMSFDSGVTHIPRGYAIALASLPIKRAREISLEIDTFNANVRLDLLTDLPGNAQASRFNTTFSTGTAGRRFFRIPLPAGTNAPIEGRMFRLQLSGTSKFVLYGAAIEILAVGVYIEAYEASGGAVYDGREMDFGSAKPKEAREIELDVETSGALTATLYSDLPGYAEAQRLQATGIAPSGRQHVRIPLTANASQSSYPLGRFFRLIITGASAYRLYGARLLVRELGCYLTGDEATATPAAVWDSTPLDLGTERWKAYKKLEFDLQTDASATINIYTEQAGSIPTSVFTGTLNTSGLRETVTVLLPPAIRGRLFQVIISGAGVRLFAGRVWWRPMNEPDAQQSRWSWASLPIPPTPPEWQWGPLPVNPTEAQWFWARVLSVEETPDTWEFVDVPIEVTA